MGELAKNIRQGYFTDVVAISSPSSTIIELDSTNVLKMEKPIFDIAFSYTRGFPVL